MIRPHFGGPPGAWDIIHRHGMVSPAEVARWMRGVYAARADWTANFDGVQFTLGRAFYAHHEEGRTDEYFAWARHSDATVERALPGLQRRVREMLTTLLGAAVEPRTGWCGPGLHIFPSGSWLSMKGGDVHFDTEGLLPAELDARVPALSAILMLQPAKRGGGLRVWDARYQGQDELPDETLARTDSVLIDYDPGDLLVIDSYQLHQIQSFQGPTDRVSVTAHVVFSDGCWRTWF